MNNKFERETGILLHISSLPSKYGIGTFGKEAFKFVDFLSECKIKIWQILPLNVTSYGDSPYQSPSSRALNFYFIDFDILNKKGLLFKEDYTHLNFCSKETRVDYGMLYEKKIPLLKKAFSRFDVEDAEFKNFVDNNQDILDFSVFMTLKEKHNMKPRNEREEKYKFYNKETIKEFLNQNYNDVLFYLWTQFECFNEYFDLKKYAKSKHIKIMGDIPIYVSYDSVEVWKHPEIFDLDEHTNMINMAGHPADVFSKEGQLRGNPLYNWNYLKATNYEWWLNRINYSFKLYDYLRIDHFRGFSAYFSIPYGDKNAFRGKWVKGPGIDLFKNILQLPIVAEDLGLLDDAFYEFFRKTGYPGMRLVNQAFDYEGRDGYWRPSNYTENYFAYSSTHDSNTLLGLIKQKKKKKKEYEMLYRILKDECEILNVKYDVKNDKDAVLKCIELILASDSRTSIIAMQDLLRLDDKARMNFPSSIGSQNWTRRINKRNLNNNLDFIKEFLKKNIKKYDRT